MTKGKDWLHRGSQGDDGGVLTDSGAPWELSGSARVMTVPITILFPAPRRKGDIPPNSSTPPPSLPPAILLCKVEMEADHPFLAGLADFIAGSIFSTPGRSWETWVRKRKYQKGSGRPSHSSLGRKSYQFHQSWARCTQGGQTLLQVSLEHTHPPPPTPTPTSSLFWVLSACHELHMKQWNFSF